MKKKMVGIFFITLLLVATGITVAGNMKLISNSSNVAVNSKEPEYNPAGSWMRSDGAYISTTTLISYEYGGRYAQNGEYLASDPDLWWVPIDAVTLSDIHGESVRTGHNTYYGTLLAYAIDENYNIVYYVTYCGCSKMTSPDTSESYDVYVSFYSPDQDPFGEDTPAYGCYGPYAFSYERIQISPTSGP